MSFEDWQPKPLPEQWALDAWRRLGGTFLREGTTAAKALSVGERPLYADPLVKGWRPWLGGPVTWSDFYQRCLGTIEPPEGREWAAEWAWLPARTGHMTGPGVGAVCRNAPSGSSYVRYHTSKTPDFPDVPAGWVQLSRWVRCDDTAPQSVAHPEREGWLLLDGRVVTTLDGPEFPDNRIPHGVWFCEVRRAFPTPGPYLVTFECGSGAYVAAWNGKRLDLAGLGTGSPALVAKWVPLVPEGEAKATTTPPDSPAPARVAPAFGQYNPGNGKAVCRQCWALPMEDCPPAVGDWGYTCADCKKPLYRRFTSPIRALGHPWGPLVVQTTTKWLPIEWGDAVSLCTQSTPTKEAT